MSTTKTRAERCRTAVLVLLFTRRHAMLASDIAAALRSTYTADEVHAAVTYLHDASSVFDAPRTIRWTSEGWLIAEAGVDQVRDLLAIRTAGGTHAHR